MRTQHQNQGNSVANLKNLQKKIEKKFVDFVHYKIAIYNFLANSTHFILRQKLATL